jgi:hypothetical protein
LHLSGRGGLKTEKRAPLKKKQCRYDERAKRTANGQNWLDPRENRLFDAEHV